MGKVIITITDEDEFTNVGINFGRAPITLDDATFAEKIGLMITKFIKTEFEEYKNE